MFYSSKETDAINQIKIEDMLSPKAKQFYCAMNREGKRKWMKRYGISKYTTTAQKAKAINQLFQ